MATIMAATIMVTNTMFVLITGRLLAVWSSVQFGIAPSRLRGDSVRLIGCWNADYGKGTGALSVTWRHSGSALHIGLCAAPYFKAPYFKLRLIGTFAISCAEASLAGDNDFVALHHNE